MKLFVALCGFIVFQFIAIAGFAQQEVEIGGVKYVMHKVSKSETVFSLCQKYKVTPAELQAANPGLSAVLQAGSTVKIPVGKVAEVRTESAKSEPKSKKEEEVYYHKVGKNQTIYSIARQYEITADELIRNNPELKDGLQQGQILKIPAVQAIRKTSISEKENSNRGFSEHQVAAGETFFSLEQKYKVTQQELVKANPELQDGLKTGMRLKIPVSGSTATEEPSSNSKSFQKYKVEKGETLFSIATRFGVEVSEMKKINPSLLSRSLEAGEIILIPQMSGKNESVSGESVIQKEQVAANGSAECAPRVSGKSQTYKVGLLLPFYLGGDVANDYSGDKKSRLVDPVVFKEQVDAGVSDTAMMVNGVNIDHRAIGFLDFYEGVLLAADSLRRSGMNVELYAFDAGTQEKISQLLQMDEFFELNLIIGPVYPELMQSVASFGAKNRIPVVTPLSSGGDFERNNSWFFKVNPTKDYQVEQTANYVASEFRTTNFFLLQSGGSQGNSEAELANLCKERFMKQGNNRFFHEYSFQRQGVNDIKPLLNENGENVFIIPSDNEAQVSVAVTNLTALAEHYNIVLVGTSMLTKLKSIQTENYHRIRLRFLTPYFVDYNRALVKRFIGQYREVYSAEPSQFSFQGFDVSFYFMSALFRYGKDFRDCLPTYPMELTQMNFRFAKVSPMGGMMNQSLFVTSYERNFDVLNLGSFTGTN